MTNNMTRQAETVSRTMLLRVSPKAIRQTDQINRIDHALTFAVIGTRPTLIRFRL